MREKKEKERARKLRERGTDFVGRCEIEREADQSAMVGRIVRREGSLWDES